jgi:hypothetical protein
LGSAAEELKRVPAWGWLIVGLVAVGVILAVRNGSKKKQTIGNLAQPQAADLSGLTATDTTQGNAALQSLMRIEKQLTDIGQKPPTLPPAPGRTTAHPPLDLRVVRGLDRNAWFSTGGGAYSAAPGGGLFASNDFIVNPHGPGTYSVTGVGLDNAAWTSIFDPGRGTWTPWSRKESQVLV